MQVVDTFKTIDQALHSALNELERALIVGEITPSRESKDGMIEEWINDFQVPNNDGIFRLKFVIERTTEHGSARLPILDKSQPKQ